MYITPLSKETAEHLEVLEDLFNGSPAGERITTWLERRQLQIYLVMSQSWVRDYDLDPTQLHLPHKLVDSTNFLQGGLLFKFDCNKFEGS